MNYSKFEKESMEKMGWYAHYVFNCDKSPANTNIHTHGVLESFNHKDLQICLPLPPNIAHGVFYTIIENIRKGKTYEVGQLYDDVLHGYSVKFIKAREMDRTVLRIVLPDKDGLFEDGANKIQFTLLDNN